MQGDFIQGDLARSTHRLIRMLRPENVGTAETAVTWLKPLPIPPASSSRSQISRVVLPRSGGSARWRCGSRRKNTTSDVCTLPRVLQNGYRHRRRGHDAGAPRQGCLREHASLSSGHRPRRQTVDQWSVALAYRLLRQDVAENHGGFYTEDEFDIGGLRHAIFSSCSAALSQQAHRLSLRTGSGPMSASTGSTS